MARAHIERYNRVRHWARTDGALNVSLRHERLDQQIIESIESIESIEEGTGSRHTMAMGLQQRPPEHRHRRCNTRTKLKMAQ